VTIGEPPQVAAPSPPSPLPAPLPPAGAPRWRSLHGLRTALTWLLAFDALASAVVIAAAVNRIGVIDDLQSGTQFFAISDRIQNADDFATAAGVVAIVLTLATAVCFIIWMWRAAKNNEALGRNEPRLTAAWAIAGWLIPLANFVIPVLVMQDLWRGSDPTVPRNDHRWKIGPRSALVGWWWAILLVSRIGGFGTSNELGPGALESIRSNNVRAGVGAALEIVAAILAILVVRAITDRQDQCLRVQNEQWAQQLPPPPPPPPS
jgi:Domain of unknown function (DUF4328)